MLIDSHARSFVVMTAIMLLTTSTEPGAFQDTRRISVSGTGVEANLGSSRPTINADGRYIAFYSDADNLVAGDTNLASDIFVVERLTDSIERISVSSAGVEADQKSSRPSISADGRYVAFYSDATNLVTGDTNLVRDVFVRDRIANTTVRVSVNTSGAEGNAASSRPSISDNGRFVAFYSDATNLVPGDVNLFRDSFLHDRDTDTDGILDEPGAISTTLISVSTGGLQGNGDSSIPVISGNGRHVSFRSIATNLVAGDTNAERDVFVHDTMTGVTERVSVGTTGVQGNGESSRPAISEDGRFITYYSFASNLVSGDTNEYCFLDPFGQPICAPASDCFVRDRDTDADGVFDEAGAVSTVRVSVTTAGAQGNSRSEDPSISGDGRFVTFWTLATNLFAGDTNAVIDSVLHDRDVDEDGVFDEPGAISTTLVNASSAGVLGDGESKRQVVSDDGRFVAFRSDAANLVAGDTNLLSDVFIRDTVCDGAFSTSRNGSGMNPLTLSSVSPPAIGGTWSLDLDCSAHAPGVAGLVIYGAPLDGTFIKQGEILVNIFTPKLLGLTKPHAGNTVNYSLPIPNDLSLCGLRAYTQGVCLGSPGGKLSNAQDIGLGS